MQVVVHGVVRPLVIVGRIFLGWVNIFNKGPELVIEEGSSKLVVGLQVVEVDPIDI